MYKNGIIKTMKKKSDKLSCNLKTNMTKTASGTTYIVTRKLVSSINIHAVKHSGNVKQVHEMSACRQVANENIVLLILLK